MNIRRAVLLVVVVCFFGTAALAAPPVLEVSPTYLEFSAYAGGANPANQILSIWKGGGNGPLNWEVTKDCNWIVVEPNSGKSMGEVDDVNVIVDILGLAAGSYNCQLTVMGDRADNSPQIVDVNLVIYQPVIELSVTQFQFFAYEGGANPIEQILSISNSGTGILNWQIMESCSWLSAEPNSGSSAGEADDVNLSVDISGLAAGIYDCNLIISDPNAGNSPQIVDVNLVIYQPIIELSATQFHFLAIAGKSNPDDQILTISNSGTGTLNWLITEDCNWLLVEPNSGSSTGEADDVNLSVNISGLAVGIYDCNLTVSDPNAANSPQIVYIDLVIQPWAGSGTVEDPYQIWDANDMNAIGADSVYWDAHFKLMADIDLSGYTGESFNIIGTSTLHRFTGVFDGDGHTISNFTFTTHSRNILGIFGYLGKLFAGGQVRDLGLINPSVSTDTGDEVGALAGHLYYGQVINCWVEGGDVSGDQSVGGLVGYVYGDGDVEDCYYDGVVSGGSQVGGLVGGVNVSVSVWGCYSTGSVDGYLYVGGLVGRGMGSIVNSYSMSDVSGSSGVGGLVGYNYYCDVLNCYSVGSVAGSSEVGGLVGKYYDGMTYGSYWDVLTSGQASSGEGTGKTTAELQTASTFIGWGCSSVWTIDEDNDYPRLVWENKPGELITDPAYWTGSGTEADPYLIYTTEELNLIGQVWCMWDKHFKLMADIDLGSFAGAEFNIIGSLHGGIFTGVFEGNGKRISNFTYSCSNHNGIGLFRALGLGGEVRDLELEGANVDAGTGWYVGALAGYVYQGSILRCGSNNGNVSGNRTVGGLVGWHRETDSSSCFSSGSVSGVEEVGGFAGRHYEGEISNSYSEGSVTGDAKVGGFVGYNFKYDSPSWIRECYSAAGIFGNSDVGGLVGYDWSGSYTKSFWDSDVNPDVNGIGNTTNPNVIGESTANMQTESTFTDAGWDFVGEVINGTDDIWDICEGTNYPKLVWQIPVADFVCPDGVTLVDFSYFAAAWMSDPNQPNWDPICDISEPNDNVINWLDVGVFVENWLAGL